MSTFTITEVEPGFDPWTGNDGTAMATYWVHIAGEDGRGRAKLHRPANIPPPRPDQTLNDYELTTDKRKEPMLKKLSTAPVVGKATGGTWKPKDPTERAEIRSAVAVKAAVELLGIEVQAGTRFTEAETARLALTPRIEYFEAILKKAGEDGS